jgi:hypothetical protein
MLTALDHARRGLDAGFDRLNQAAGRIARDGAGGDLAGNIVDTLKARHEVGANVAVARTADEMIGTLLDVLA